MTSVKKIKIYFSIILISMIFFVFGCSHSSKTPFELSYKEIYIQVEESIKLDVISDSKEKIEFISDDESIATVSEDGIITGVKTGETKIRVNQDDYQGVCFVYVGINEPSQIYLLSYDDLNLTYGDKSVKFKALFDTMVTSNVKCDWYLNNELYLSGVNEIEFTPSIIGDFDIYVKYKDIKSNSLHFKVERPILKIAAENKEVAYLDDEVELTYKIVEGKLCYNDTISGNLIREEGNNAGEYIVSQGSLDVINEEGISVIENYDFEFINAIYKINKISQQQLTNTDVTISVSSTKITINSEVENLEYSLNGEDWQDNNKFDNLSSNSDYIVYIRIKETINYISSGVLEVNVHTLKQYTINIYATNGNPSNEENVLHQSFIFDEGDKVDISLSHPDVTGYTFINYKYILDNEEIIDSTEIHLDAIGQDINVYAMYNINVYEIKFISYDKEATYSFKYLDNLTLPDAGEKLGYVFTNWINENQEIIDENHKVVENLVLTAEYVIKSFNVVFIDSGSNVYSEVVQAYDKLLSMPENPTKEGYTFKGWNTKTDGSGTFYYTLSDLTKIKDNMYLFAYYEIEQYKVTYLDFDGSILYEEMVDYGGRASYDEIPYREGYLFIGWSASLDKVTGDISVTAQYIEL